MKIRAPGVVWSSWATLLAPRWPKMRFWTRLGLYLEVCWGASWRQDGPSCGQDGAKLPNLAPRWAQDSNLRFQNSQLETILGGILVTFWDLGHERPDSKNIKNIVLKDFDGLGGALGSYVGSSWRDVGLCWASWAPSWSNLATRLTILGDVWTSWRQGGPSCGQDGAKLANLAPRCAQDGQLGALLGASWRLFFGSWARSCQKLRTSKTTTVQHF